MFSLVSSKFLATRNMGTLYTSLVINQVIGYKLQTLKINCSAQPSEQIENGLVLLQTSLEIKLYSNLKEYSTLEYNYQFSSQFRIFLSLSLTFNICIVFLFLTNDLFFHVFQELQTNSNSRNYWTLLSICYRTINISMEHLSSETNGLFAMGWAQNFFSIIQCPIDSVPLSGLSTLQKCFGLVPKHFWRLRFFFVGIKKSLIFWIFLNVKVASERSWNKVF